MRHIIIFKSTADLARLQLSERPIASFFVSEHGIEKVEFGDDEIPRNVVVFDPEQEGEPTPITLEESPLAWADLLGYAYRDGDYRTAVAVVASAEAEDGLSVAAGITAELEAVPH